MSWLPGSAVADLSLMPANYSLIPLPAFDTDPNSGNTYGFLPVLLLKDPADRVTGILAPSVTYNAIRGITGTFRYFGYPSPSERFELIASYSERIERELDVHYQNQDIFGDRFHTDIEFLFDRDSTIRFFGLGPESKKINETNMTLQTTGLYALFGVNITPRARLSLGETLQSFKVLRGGVPDLPFTGDRYPDLPGVDGAFVHAQRASLTYDDRDSPTTPTTGLSASVFLEASARLLGSGSDYIKAGAESTYLYPLFDARLVLVAHALLEAVSGDADTPFEVLPRLGGATTLRGFSPNRFFGDGRVLFNFEARTRIFRWRLFGVDTEFQAAPFVDAGTVFTSVKQLFSNGLEVTPGLALRGISPPNVVGRVELGWSREGPAIFVGLGYPF